MDSRKLRERCCIAVCMGGDCKDRGARKLYKRLGKELAREGKAGEVRLCKAECTGACGKGIHVLVYPGGPWFYEAEPGDAKAIAERAGEE